MRRTWIAAGMVDDEFPSGTPCCVPSRAKRVLGLVGAALVVGGVAFYFLGRVFVLGQSAPAKVVETKRSSQGMCWPVLEYQAAGELHRAEPSVRYSGECDVEVGDSVTVLAFALWVAFSNPKASETPQRSG